MVLKAKSIYIMIVPKTNMFFRIKKINNTKYAYLVDNKWYKRKGKGRGRGSRQKVKKYLGRVYEFNKVEDKEFPIFKNIDNMEEYINNNEKNSIIKDLISWEVFRHKIGNEFIIDSNKIKVLKDNKEVSLALNEGFLNSYTLARLINYKFGHNEQEGYKFAEAFIQAGIDIPKDVFIGIFGKVYK